MVIVTLQREKCIGCNYCVEAAPEQFQMSKKDGKSVLLRSTDKKGFFTLKSYNQASPVGYVMKANSLEDESPVEYPKVTVYTSWHIFNGRLYIYKGIPFKAGLYGLYVVIAILGWFKWKRMMLNQQNITLQE